MGVSTHSRPKAAGRSAFQKSAFLPCFNTQPPEGGWVNNQHFKGFKNVSTHSRPKAAGKAVLYSISIIRFQHTAARRRLVDEATEDKLRKLFQHTAARRRLGNNTFKELNHGIVSTHSRPKAAGDYQAAALHYLCVSTHSRPKAAGGICQVCKLLILFQHTAARRRLG